MRKIYALALGMRRELTPGNAVARSICSSFRSLVARTEAATGDNLSHLAAFLAQEGDIAAYNEFKVHVGQLISFLEVAYDIGDKTARIGTLLNSIEDAELMARCSDILSASGHFDRVIAQATVILEDRIRKKVGGSPLTGVSLVNAHIKAKPTESTIVLSEEPGEQEGYSHIYRGIMLALRNETHHHVVDKFSREEAFHICGFIDRLLKLIDEAKVRS